MKEKLKLIIVLLIGILVGPIVLFGVFNIANIYTAEEALSYIVNTIIVAGAISAVLIVVLLLVSKKSE